MAPTISKRYRTDPISSFAGPKPGGGWRTFAILSDRDEHTWRNLARQVAKTLEPRLDPRVAANRTVVARGGWRLEAMRVAMRRARAIAPRHGLLLRTDVEAFYASITPPVLVSVLARLGIPTEEARLAGRMIEGWSESGYVGLPIGPAGSAVLANAVLRSVDEALDAQHFVRWVDDYLIALPSEQATAGILDRLDASLERLHLRRSVPKTEVLEGITGVAWLRGNPPAFASPAQR
jgi:hypothetical protein